MTSEKKQEYSQPFRRLTEKGRAGRKKQKMKGDRMKKEIHGLMDNA